AFTANTIIRDPSWRKRDAGGTLRMSTVDADRLGVAAGDRIRLTTRRGRADIEVEPTHRMRARHLSLPHGLGLPVRDEHGVLHAGLEPNELTADGDRDEWAGTPWHKHVLAKVEALPKSKHREAHPVREMAVLDRAHGRSDRRLVDAPCAARGVLRHDAI